MLDKRMLKLARFLETNTPYEKLPEYFEMSQRNLYRLFNNWEADGYITLNTRVHNDKSIVMNIDVEKELFIEVVTKSNNMKIQEIKEYLNLPWRDHSKEAIQRIIKDKIYSLEHNESNINTTGLIDYVYFIPENFNPNISLDYVSAQIGSQIAETLYCIDSEGNLMRNLIKYDEIIDDYLHIHLQDHIKFSNGQYLTAQDVKATLDLLKQHEIFGEWFSIIKSIELVDKFILKLEVPEFKELIKFMLSEPCAVITKDYNNKKIGTGPYQINKYDTEKIELEVNPFYRNPADIQAIYLISNPYANFEDSIGDGSFNETIETYASHDSIMFNPSTQLTLDERRYFIQAIQNVMYDIENLSSLTYEILYEKNNIQELITIDKPIKILINEYIKGTFQQVQEKLKNYNINLELVEIPYKEIIQTNLNHYDVDLIWISECYWSSMPYKMISLLLPGKLQEWYMHMEATKNFIEEIRTKGLTDIKEASKDYERWFNDQYYRIEMLKKYKKLVYSSKYKNISVNPYGIIDYGKIIHVE